MKTILASVERRIERAKAPGYDISYNPKNKLSIVLEFNDYEVFNVRLISQVFPIWSNVPKKNLLDSGLMARSVKEMKGYLESMLNALPIKMRDYNKFTPEFKKDIVKAIGTIQNAINSVQDLDIE